MQLTAPEAARVPAENLRVDAQDFVALWLATEARLDGATGGDWYLAGVADVCRWLGRATVRPPAGPWFAARAPVSGRVERACPELIEEECRFAESLTLRPHAFADRPGWLDGVCAAFRWAWCSCSAPSVGADARC